MTSLRGQIARVFLCMVVLTAIAGLTAVPARSAPFAAHVMDARTGETLIAQNADTRLHPASLTKMLTLYITFDAIRRGEITLDTMVTVSANAASKPPSRLGLRTGQRIAVRHLIRAAAIKSANDAASALGDHLGGDEAGFARRMNRTAKALGMKNSTFKNANGLTAAGHLSTASDMSVLGRRLFYDFPEYYNIFSRRSTDAGVATVVNTNSRFLDSYAGADGIKTGYTVAAGFNLTASAERGPVRLITTVFGGTSTAQRNAKVSELMNEGFKRAPASATTRKPAPARIPDADVEGPMVVAKAPAATVSGTAPGTSGKTIRLVTTLRSSPRPLSRPGAADVQAAALAVAALQPSINDAIAAAAAPDPEPEILPFAVIDTNGNTLSTAGQPATVPAGPTETVVAATAPIPTRPLPFAVVDGADIPPPPTAETPLPFAVVDADGNALAPPTGTPFGKPVVLPYRPLARPATLVAAVPDVPVAETAAPVSMAATAPATDLPFAVVAAEPPATDLPFAVVAAEPPPSAPVVPETAVAAPDDIPEPTSEPTMIASLSASAAPRMAEPAVASATPAVVTALRPAPKADAPVSSDSAPVVLTRLSTSGGRHWGISLGRFPSRMAAEQALMRVGLSDGAVLGDGLRKVVGGGRGYDANVLGLSQDQAELACRRLAARAQNCTTLGP